MTEQEHIVLGEKAGRFIGYTLGILACVWLSHFALDEVGVHISFVARLSLAISFLWFLRMAAVAWSRVK